MNRLEAMKTLLDVVDAGSLSAASRKLRTPLATISRRIADLVAVNRDDGVTGAQPGAVGRATALHGN